MILVYSASCLFFAAVFVALRVWPMTRAVTAQLRANLAVIGDAGMSDEEKEATLRRGSLAVLRETVRLTASLSISIGAAALPVVLAETAGWLSYEAFIGFSIDPLVILATIVAFAALARFGRAILRSA